MRRIKHIGVWLVDYAHMLRADLLMFVHRNPPRHYLGYVKEGKAPVILLPGILEKWSFIKHLGDKISYEGHPVYVVPELGYNIKEIPSAANKIDKLIKDQNLKGVVVVGHSKGGLIGKYLLANLNKDHQVLGVVAVATPFSGSRLAKLVPYNSFKELSGDSKIIHDLEKHKEVNHQIISIIPEYDNHVWAEEGSYLAGARENIKVPVKGHHKVVFDSQVLKEVLKGIQEFK